MSIGAFANTLAGEFCQVLSKFPNGQPAIEKKNWQNMHGCREGMITTYDRVIDFSRVLLYSL